MCNYSLKASLMVVGAAFLSTVATGCQGPVAAAPASPSALPATSLPAVTATQPVPLPTHTDSSSTPTTVQYPLEQQFDLINARVGNNELLLC